ncbi:M23 family metallopeptidase [Terrihabitans sp. B22-R8]|uniref:M23 family metallopeptidase n=1 Tax=Terrihabitans sp. B22-R8 TaxID=3425128 RepID=UPI00403D4FC1
MLTRAPRYGLSRAQTLDLGHEPPLLIDGDSGGPGGSRQVNLRWLAGTTLAGALGTALLGAAIFASMDGSYRLAEAPGAFVQWDAYGVHPRSSNATRKSDRIEAARDVDETRQVMRVSTTTRQGERELVRTRSVTRISTSLLTSGVDTQNIPAFNPAAILSGGGGDDDSGGSDQGPGEVGDISYVVRSLVGMDLASAPGPSIPLEQVVAAVRDAGAIEAVRSTDLQHMASIGEPQAASAAAVMALPNMTVIAKKPASAASENDQERVIVVRKGDRLEQILLQQGARPGDARQIAEAFGAQSGYGTAGLDEGQTVRILMGASPSGPQPVRIIVGSEISQSVVALSDTGGYVSVAEAPEIAEEGDEPEIAERPSGGGATKLSLYESLYATALAKSVPEPVVKEMIRIFGNDADFQRRAGTADSFEVLFTSDENGAVDGTPEVLFALLKDGGETRRYYRFQLPGDGGTDYFDENGRSARKFLMRKPVAQAVMRSGFGMRRHPIIGISKMHTGVDWAAPRGTAIYAAGNGIVDKAGRTSGYGNQVRIQHSNGYETTYNHMNGFARGIKPGVRVRQGQLIGYVGSTGLSTGPHLHYEVLVNGRFVNPMRIKVPRGQELDGTALAEFRRERARIDGLMGHSATSAAQLNTDAAEGG